MANAILAPNLPPAVFDAYNRLNSDISMLRSMIDVTTLHEFHIGEISEHSRTTFGYNMLDKLSEVERSTEGLWLLVSQQFKSALKEVENVNG